MKFTNKVIMSAEKYDKNEIHNAERTIKLKEILDSKGYKYKLALGVYNKIKEVSFIIDTDGREDVVDQLDKIAEKHFDQESILVTDDEGFARLRYCGTNNYEALGEMKQISRDEALKEYAYTMVDGSFYKAEL